MSDFHVYDTTLRDGAQQEGLNLSVADKLAIAAYLDDLGVGYIEGGWPGANPKDTEFFRQARTALDLRSAKLAAFGSTRRAGAVAADDPQVRALLDAQTDVVTLVAKSHSRHVTEALRTTPEENLAMIQDTVSFLVGEGRSVFLDAEHFFDGYRADPAYALEVVRTAAAAGAEVIALCDTNGGMLPPQVTDVVGEVIAGTQARLGIHCHNDTGCAVANSLAAVEAGASHVQGTINGYGERTGNADLVTVVSNLQLKQGREVVEPERLRQALHLSHAISEVTNVVPYSRQPYVGASAFAHKAGLHASALKVDPDLYQHTDPSLVGNSMRTLVSDMAGRASIELKGKELGYDLTGQPDLLGRVVGRVKELEQQGWTFDAADASFELLLREEVTGEKLDYFDAESWRIITESGDQSPSLSEATVKLTAAGKRVVATGEGNGPVNALDHALREALTDAYPELATFELIDFRVRILDAAHGTDATTRVLIETSDGKDSWQTLGVAPNIVHASWTALVDSFSYGLLKQGVLPRR
ncbi:citramalate synthase [Flexivirga meconopsidis]|uniref:citramalate synthase n=1 Tax=Flexivirga meconopsidis TaxID=2977121 RepID=UPI00223FE613|nr:citramalate synthase [Flexivirga meconopsidis]